MLAFAEGVRSGAIRGSGGAPFERWSTSESVARTLGPAMAVEALRPFAAGAPRIDFVSNVDGNRLADVLAVADPARTLFIVCFQDLHHAGNAHQRKHRAGLAHRQAGRSGRAGAFRRGLGQCRRDGCLRRPPRPPLHDVGLGRRALFPLVVDRRLAGDRHRRDALQGIPRRRRRHGRAFPVRAVAAEPARAAWACWESGTSTSSSLPTLAVLPYDDRLARFPAYLQQLDMESNGKSGATSMARRCTSEPRRWSGASPATMPSIRSSRCCTRARRAPRWISCCRRTPPAATSRPHDLAIANCLAQAEAFAFGQSIR